MRKIHALVLAISLISTNVSAYAQDMLGIPLGQEKEVDPETRAKREAIDKSYRSTTQKIPEQKANDPWGSVRSAEQPAKPLAKQSSKPSKRPIQQ